MGGELVQIRDAEAADLGAIFAIYNHEVENTVSTFDTEPRDPDADADWLTAREPRYPVLVALRAGELLGWGAISQWRRAAPTRGRPRSPSMSTTATGVRGSAGSCSRR